jgi:hypothetical protein
MIITTLALQANTSTSVVGGGSYETPGFAGRDS